MSDVNINPEPVTDTGTGEYPMTRPTEVTVTFEGGAESTMEYPMSRPAEVTVESVDETGSTMEYPVSSMTVRNEEAVTDETPAVTEAENEIVEPDTKSPTARKSTPRKRA
jgi:hypothetical protein